MNPLRLRRLTPLSVSSRLLRLSIFLLLSLPDSRGRAIWTAHVNITFRVGNRVVSELGENGVFGNHSPLEKVSGAVVLPEGWNQNACNPLTNFSKPEQADSWLPLIERGGCTFTHKINLAAEKGANGVIIYNYQGTGNKVFPVSHQGTKNIVVIMISNQEGMKIVHLIHKGIYVRIIIEVGRMHVPWLRRYAVFLLTLLVATLAYLYLYRLGRARVPNYSTRRRRQIKADVKKAVSRLQLRVLKDGDKELGPNEDNCVVCFDTYKPQDVVRILTCKHFFHKKCIDPWLIAHRTCPMCKYDILKTREAQRTF
ncbi:RING finger protein 148 [Ctenodactylus gundi]